MFINAKQLEQIKFIHEDHYFNGNGSCYFVVIVHWNKWWKLKKKFKFRGFYDPSRDAWNMPPGYIAFVKELNAGISQYKVKHSLDDLL